MSWFTESNRYKHFWGIMAMSFIGTILMGIGCALGLEIKDCQSDYRNQYLPVWQWRWDNWDWLDILAGLLGGIIGQAMQLLIIYFIFF